MANELVIIGYYVMWGLLVITSICFLISGLDDLFIDVYYWILYVWRLYKFRNAKKLTYARLSAPPQKRIAVMIPCWHEAGVIEQMLRYNVYAIDYDEYDLFVGVYPNDPETINSVVYISQLVAHVQVVINSKPGPTTKADNLNCIFQFIKEYERKYQIEYDIFVLHDSEDVIHALSFKLYNYLTPKNDMIQIPMFPLEVGLRHLTHWTYNAEFTETHTKDIIVREHIGGLVPSAGVGTAFTRKTMELLKEKRGGVPFATNTLTEDYSTALQIRLHGLRQIFVTQSVYRQQFQKRFYFFGKSVPRVVKEFIATRALFPMEYSKAVKQKARWILGISFQEWINTGWQGNLPTLYTLIHDRKALFTHLITGLFFILIPFWLLYLSLTANSPDYPTLQDRFENSPWVWTVIVIASVLMVGRILQRMIAVFRVYGLIPAILTPPLILYGNIINLHALLRAYWLFIYQPKAKSGGSGGGPKWEKTDHMFPVQNLLVPYKFRLGDLLLENKLLTKEQLTQVLDEQARTGEQLGTVLLKHNFVTKENLTKLLAKQYGLPIVERDHVIPLPFEALPKLSKYQYDTLIKIHCIPISVSENEVTFGIQDPSDEVKIAKVLRMAKPYRSHFVLISA